MPSLGAIQGTPIFTSVTISSTHNYEFSSLVDPIDPGALQKALATIQPGRTITYGGLFQDTTKESTQHLSFTIYTSLDVNANYKMIGVLGIMQDQASLVVDGSFLRDFCAFFLLFRQSSDQPCRFVSTYGSSDCTLIPTSATAESFMCTRGPTQVRKVLLTRTVMVLLYLFYHQPSVDSFRNQLYEFHIVIVISQFYWHLWRTRTFLKTRSIVKILWKDSFWRSNQTITVS